MSPFRQRCIERGQRNRDAVAASELAICLPLLVTMLLATVEVCTMYQVKQSLKVSAYEGARVGIVPDAKSSNVQFQVDSLLSGFAVQSATVSTVPSNPQSLSEGEYFTVTVSAPFGDNSLIGGWLYADVILSGSAALRKD